MTKRRAASARVPIGFREPRIHPSVIFRALAAGFAVAFGIVLARGSQAATHPVSGFERYAVEIVRGRVADPNYHGAGAGIYMGKGLVLTAAHVAGRPTETNPDTVVVDDRYAAASLVKLGSYEGVDVTLLSVDPAAMPPRMRDLPALSLCVDMPVPGQTVTVVAPGNVRDSVIVPSTVLSPELQKQLPTLIRDVYSTGNSGSGVFDSEIGCLMGIMSRKIESRGWQDENGLRKQVTIGVAKYFVPARAIAEFLGNLL